MASNLKRWLVWGGKTAVAALFILVITSAILVYEYAQRDDAQQVDAAIVLGAAVFGERPSPVLRERINHAITLYEDGYIKTIIFTGGKGERDSLSEAEAAQRYAIANGIPPSAILLEDKSTNTWENLIYAQRLAQQHGLSSFLIVSTPFHMKRALGIAQQLGMDAYTSPTRTTQWISWYTKSRAYTREVFAYIAYLSRADRTIVEDQRD